MQEELAGNGAVGLNSETGALHDFEGSCVARGWTLLSVRATWLLPGCSSSPACKCSIKILFYTTHVYICFFQ